MFTRWRNLDGALSPAANAHRHSVQLVTAGILLADGLETPPWLASRASIFLRYGGWSMAHPFRVSSLGGRDHDQILDMLRTLINRRVERNHYLD